MSALTQTCLTCGKHFSQSYTTHYDEDPPRVVWHEHTTCDDCEQTALFSRLTAEQQQQVDELIYGNAILQGILLLKRGLGIGLADSNLLFSWRYHKLRESHPRKFSRSDSDYWDGFYS
jgi:hypothetical protein